MISLDRPYKGLVALQGEVFADGRLPGRRGAVAEAEHQVVDPGRFMACSSPGAAEVVVVVVGECGSARRPL